MTPARRRRYRKIMLTAASILGALFLFLLLFANRIMEPILRERLQTFIVSGSDSLYTYSLGNLHTNFLGADVEVENLQIRIDSSRYRELERQHRLPILTMELALKQGHIHGLKLLPLFFNKKIRVREIISEGANLRLSRHTGQQGGGIAPVWRSIQPQIRSISIDAIRLRSLKLLYRHADTSQSVKLQFDECNAVFDDVRIDSAAARDTGRTAYSKDIALRIHDMKYRTEDSMYKMKAEYISYSTRSRQLQIDSFKLQPTLEKEDFYSLTKRRDYLYFLAFARTQLTGASLDDFIHADRVRADSLSFDRPEMQIYLDKGAPIENYPSKMGRYPHQQLMHASTRIDIGRALLRNGTFRYTERNGLTREEGSLLLEALGAQAGPVVNEPARIKTDPVCGVEIGGKVQGSPVALSLRFFLNDSNGHFEAHGHFGALTAAQLTGMTRPLADVTVNSGVLQSMEFDVQGWDQRSVADLRLLYHGLSLTLLQPDSSSGAARTNSFLTRLMNRFVIYPDNPMPGATERKGHVERLRISSESLFSFLWKTVYMAMEDVLMRSGVFP